MANKGFSLDLDSEKARRPAPKFRTSSLDFDNSSVDNELWFLAHTEKPESKTGRFLGLSVMAHALLAIGIFTISAPLFETPKPETIEIEIADTTPMPIPRGSRVPETMGARAASAPKFAPQPVAKELPATADDVIVAKPKSQPHKTQAKMKVAAQAAPKITRSKAVRTAPVLAKVDSVSRVQPMTTVSEVEVPESVDDLDAPQLEETEFNAKTAGEYNDGDLEKNFAKVDATHAKGLKAVKDEMDQDADNMAKDDLNSLEEMDRETQREAQIMAARSTDLKKKNAAALAAAQAEENAAREKSAHAAAARAEAYRNAQALAAAGRGGKGIGGGKAGVGSGAQGSNVAGNPVGNSNGVRRLEQLRQMPGNPKPRYNDNERMAKQQGQVAYFAFISREGVPSQFRQVKSTGYSNLDGKTLEALKKWRFYPGQEGWVEIPFSWDIRGGVNETRALGSRQAGSNRGSLRTSNY